MASYQGTTGNDVFNWQFQAGLFYDGLTGTDTVNIIYNHAQFGTILFDSITGKIGVDDSSGITVSSASIQLTSVEKLTFIDGWTVQIGSAGNDTINGGASVDQLYGQAGNDVLNGGVGADNLFGGIGNDVYVVDNISDRVYETTTITSGIDAGGTDIINSTIAYTLGSFIENLTLTGISAINGTGNVLNNTLIGNSAANTLSGLDGKDTLIGGAGQDILIGGTGNDIFDFNTIAETATGTTRDIIKDFTHGTDRIDLSSIDANPNIIGDQAFIYKEGKGFTSFTSTSVGTIYYDTTSGILYGNNDIDSTADFTIQIGIKTLHPNTLNAADFIL